ncbi:hypothetical protein DFJ73DRAFT_838839 [Zopfochytrium polystomum]|nr:hypothetical protein DFJ73DRAFT_838839 [Zopfochytrium polystomum]
MPSAAIPDAHEAAIKIAGMSSGSSTPSSSSSSDCTVLQPQPQPHESPSTSTNGDDDDNHNDDIEAVLLPATDLPPVLPRASLGATAPSLSPIQLPQLHHSRPLFTTITAALHLPFPPEIVAVVLARLPAAALFRLRRLSRSYLSLVDQLLVASPGLPQYIALHNARLSMLKRHMRAMQVHAPLALTSRRDSSRSTGGNGGAPAQERPWPTLKDLDEMRRYHHPTASVVDVVACLVQVSPLASMLTASSSSAGTASSRSRIRRLSLSTLVGSRVAPSSLTLSSSWSAQPSLSSSSSWSVSRSQWSLVHSAINQQSFRRWFALLLADWSVVSDYAVVDLFWRLSALTDNTGCTDRRESLDAPYESRRASTKRRLSGWVGAPPPPSPASPTLTTPPASPLTPTAPPLLPLPFCAPAAAKTSPVSNFIYDLPPSLFTVSSSPVISRDFAQRLAQGCPAAARLLNLLVAVCIERLRVRPLMTEIRRIEEGVQKWEGVLRRLKDAG